MNRIEGCYKRTNSIKKDNIINLSIYTNQFYKKPATPNYASICSAQ